MKKIMIRDIKIHPVLNGFVVTVGCQVVVFEGACKMLEELQRYLVDPDGVEASYRKQATNAWLLQDQLPEPCCGSVEQAVPAPKQREQRAQVNSMADSPKPFLNR